MAHGERCGGSCRAVGPFCHGRRTLYFHEPSTIDVRVERVLMADMPTPQAQGCPATVFSMPVEVQIACAMTKSLTPLLLRNADFSASSMVGLAAKKVHAWDTDMAPLVAACAPDAVEVAGL